MSFQVKIKNIGKLADADIRIGDLTVFAGPNNTGKSFVSKLLYSLFNAMNAKHIANCVRTIVDQLPLALRSPESEFFSGHADLASLTVTAKKLEDLLHNYRDGNFKKLDVTWLDILGELGKLEENLNLSIQKTKEKKEELPPSLTNFVYRKNALLEIGFRTYTATCIGKKIQEGLIGNFQVSQLFNLQKEKDKESEVDIHNFGKIELLYEGIEFDMRGYCLHRDYSDVIYLESPFYWKLKNALEIIEDPYDSIAKMGRKRLSGVPEYFYDLARALKFQYTGDMAFPNVYERLTGKDVIGGKVALSETGDLLFRENARQFPMSLTATGVANLGILALLIERKVLDKGTFLFIDEPEAHLHPAWQVIMAEALFNIAKQGAKVVIATHSPDILKWLEVHAKENPEDKKLIALNHFTHQGVRDSEQDFEVKMAMIKKSLTEPFSNLYLKGLTL